MIGQTISQYKILEKLGEGGMGVVYKAHDTKLNRTVALKFLPQYLSTDVNEKERFYHEARAASALLHANVAVIFEVNEYDGKIYLAMEYVEGETLKEFIKGSDQLSVKKVLDIAIQACDGLSAAHEKGIVHRDIKSDNIMITPKGQVKIMDFGLAKVKGATKLTKAGSTLGTAAYMSPEQVQGEEVDHRSDIFSFGVVLYELLTSKLPFRGEHQAALMYSLINDDPQPIARFNENVPPDVERIVLKALAKDRDDRYQHADDLLADLRRERKQLEYAKAGYTTTRSTAQAVPLPRPKKPAMKMIVTGGIFVVIALAASFLLLRRGPAESAATGPSRKMLAVIPFENLGPADQEYFADGMTEEITSRLSGLSGLGVIARSSAMQYKKTTKPIRQIGEELGVSYILQGTIRWENVDGVTRVRVNPQLISVADGTQMWSQPSEAVLASSFKLQSEIAGQVANALNVTLLQHEKQSLEAKLTDNSEAYDLYLRGSDYVYRSSDERDLRIAEQMFTQAVALDPNFTEAFAKLAVVHAGIYWEFYDHSTERVVKSKEAAQRALQLNPNLPAAHGAMGWYYYHALLDYENATKEFSLGLQSEPNNIDLLLGIASVLRRQGKFEEAAGNFRKALEIDPRSANLNDELGNTLNLLHRYAEAGPLFDKAMNLSPDLGDPYADKVIMFVLQGDTAGARELLNVSTQRKVGGDNPYIIRYTLILSAIRAQYTEGLNYLDHLEAKIIASQNFYTPKELAAAHIYGCMGETRKAVEQYDAARVLLEKALQTHPDDTRIMSSLGIAYAGIGRKDEALKSGKRAVELLPVSREALIGTNRLEDLALIYTMVGDQEAAISTLEHLVSIPSWMSPALVRLDPAWKPLANNPRFHKLVTPAP